MKELTAGIGNRIATVVINLQKAEEGGDIYFIGNDQKQISFPLQRGNK